MSSQMYSPQDASQGGGKRQRGDDWTCAYCGNVNFAFRTTCNMRKCGKERSDAPEQQGGKASKGNGMQSAGAGSQGFPLTNALAGGYNMGYNMGGVTPPMANMMGNMAMPLMNMNMGMDPSLMMGMGGMGMGAMGMGGLGAGMGMGMGNAMGMPPQNFGNLSMGADDYGAGRDDGSRKRRGGPDAKEQGDWYCMACGNMNFAFRTTCNMRKCGAAKPEVKNGGQGGTDRASQGRKRGGDGPEKKEETPPDGSWTCACGNVNYPFRTKCNRRNCGLPRPGTDGGESNNSVVEE